MYILAYILTYILAYTGAAAIPAAICADIVTKKFRNKIKMSFAATFFEVLLKNFHDKTPSKQTNTLQWLLYFIFGTHYISCTQNPVIKYTCQLSLNWIVDHCWISITCKPPMDDPPQENIKRFYFALEASKFLLLEESFACLEGFALLNQFHNT